jgi:hypothetical protein
MPNSPLDGSFESSKKRLKPKWVLALIALIATGVGGGVFAISIGVNSGGNVEFGQGFASLTACDDAVTLTPTSVFNGTVFKLQSIVVGGVNTDTTNATSGVGCGTKSLIVKAYNSATAVIAEASISVSPTSATSITLSPTASPNATEVLKITIESQ